MNLSPSNDPDGSAGDLTISVTSSEQGVLPSSGIQISGQGTDRTISMTPADGVSGFSIVTLTVQDPDGLTATDSFAFIASGQSPNDPPTVSAIADQFIDEDTSTPVLAFTVDDEDTDPNDISVDATSSDQSIIPDGNITLGGSGMNRTISVTPAADQFGGPVVITISAADDEGGVGGQSFDVTVASINDNPTISPIAPSITIDEDGSTGTLSFTIGDIETSPERACAVDGVVE